jgi:NADPH:quinone reductase-like Zn-dependent oxidoreductase
MILEGQGRLVRAYSPVPGIDFAGTVLRSDSPEFRSGDPVVLTGWRGRRGAMGRNSGDHGIIAPHGNRLSRRATCAPTQCQNISIRIMIGIGMPRSQRRIPLPMVCLLHHEAQQEVTV